MWPREILVVNENCGGRLQVQKKCLGKMRDVIAGGQTVFRASHNMSQPDDATIKYPANIEARRNSERSPGRGKSTKLSCNRGKSDLGIQAKIRDGRLRACIRAHPNFRAN